MIPVLLGALACAVIAALCTFAATFSTLLRLRRWLTR